MPRWRRASLNCVPDTKSTGPESNSRTRNETVPEPYKFRRNGHSLRVNKPSFLQRDGSATRRRRQPRHPLPASSGHRRRLGEEPGCSCHRVGHAVWTTVFGNAVVYHCARKHSSFSAVVYYCARKHSSFSASGDTGFSVLTPVVTGARNLKKVLFKGDWSQSR
jgi:hypothetical protein